MKTKLKPLPFLLINFSLICVSGLAFAQTESFDCLIEPNSTIEVSSPVHGVLEKVDVVRGDRVKKGQRLFNLHSQLESAHVALAKEKAEFGQRTVFRNEELVKQQLLSTQERDEMETDANLAKMELREAKVRLNQKSVSSPINGHVIERFKSPGEYVDDKPILTLVSIDPLFVEVIVPIKYFGQIKEGTQASVVPEAPLDTPRNAKVRIVDPVVDPASGTFRVRLEIPNKNSSVPSGLKCKVTF